MKLFFKKIKMKNFMSVGHKPIEIEFLSGINLVNAIENNGTTNGQGKTTLFIDPIVFAIYGKSIRNINKNEIINNINEKECEVTLWFDLDGVPYRIERGLEPDYSRIINEKEEIEKKEIKENSKKRQTKQAIEDLLNISYVSFVNSITLNIIYSKPFFRLTTSERREILEDIMNISIYGKMYDSIKKDSNLYKQEKKIIENDVKNLLNKYTDKKDSYEKYETLKNNFYIEK